jgi:hypothetical protein
MFVVLLGEDMGLICFCEEGRGGGSLIKAGNNVLRNSAKVEERSRQREIHGGFTAARETTVRVDNRSQRPRYWKLRVHSRLYLQDR